LILQPRFDAEELLKLISLLRVTHLHLVPVMFNRLLALPSHVRANYDLGSMKCVAHAAAPVSIAAKRAMIDWWGPIFSEYYGATEVGMVARCSTEEWCQRPGTVGRALPGARVAILNQEGEHLPAGEIGEVAVRLDSIADFTYRGDEAKRTQVARRDGLIGTGDVGYLDQDGYLFLSDRSADIVISGGVNIYTAEIESLLLGLAGIADCAVIGIPDEEYGEKLCAILQVKPGVALTAAHVQEHLRGEIASFKIPKVIEFRAHLGREDSGKLFKRQLREDYWKGHDRRIG
jgi:long-chain acyl-CoA synthetase